jgi:hypothetical protein
MYPCTWHLEKADGIHNWLHVCRSLRYCISWIGKHAVASMAYVDLAHTCRSRSFGTHSRSEMQKSHVDHRISNLPVGHRNAAPEE